MSDEFNLTDEAALEIFFKQMAHKLGVSARKGRHGWQTCSQADLTRMLRAHVEKGDPVDVVNFCMMLSALGYGITKGKPASIDRGVDDLDREDIARSEFESAMAFGISLDNFMRLAKTVRDRASGPDRQSTVALSLTENTDLRLQCGGMQMELDEVRGRLMEMRRAFEHANFVHLGDLLRGALEVGREKWGDKSTEVARRTKKVLVYVLVRQVGRTKRSSDYSRLRGLIGFSGPTMLHTDRQTWRIGSNASQYIDENIGPFAISPR